MARFKDGLLGAFTGKAGNIVGSTWNNVRVVKAAGPSTRKNDSPAQVEQQAKFSLAFNFVRNMKNLFDFTYKSLAKKMTAGNKALGVTVSEAIIGDYPNFLIDYSQVLVSRGPLKPELKQTIVLSVAAGILKWQWNFVQGKFGTKGTDKAILVAYCPAYDHYLSMEENGPARSANTGTLDVTPFMGQTVQTWIAFISADKKKDLSNSVYTGQIVVA